MSIEEVDKYETINNLIEPGEILIALSCCKCGKIIAVKSHFSTGEGKKAAYIYVENKSFHLPEDWELVDVPSKKGTTISFQCKKHGGGYGGENRHARSYSDPMGY